MKAGDVVKLCGIPPNLKDEGDLPTRTLFEKSLGQLFVVAGVDSVDGVPTPLAVVEVIGLSISDRLRNKFSQFGFNQFESTPQGFWAMRPLPSDYSPDRWR
jgi:hypothetical protein